MPTITKGLLSKNGTIIIPHKTIEPGKDADLIIMGRDFYIKKVIIGGKEVL
ncbi:MAG: hypothetical protein JSW18_00035 [Candidatus Omnitrophota bacterium]|nr:MAG: hypothetical protein JSW18_00035 [Candidatus Omnitrophota bacterium]